MYKIFVDNTVIFDDISPVESLKLIEPKLTMEDNAAGSLTFRVPPCNIGYNLIHCMTSELIVTRDDVEIWRGRPIQEELDFWKCKKYMVEGELAYLNDTIQLPRKYTAGTTTIATFLQSLISYHNSQVGGNSNKRFEVQNNSVTVDDGDTLDDSAAINRFTNYETTLKCINEKLVDRLGGHLRIRHSGNTRYLDYLQDYSEIGASDQIIRFGSNLLDYAQNLDSINWVTAIVPRGKRLEIDESEQPVQGLEAYTNVSTIDTQDGTWHAANSYYVTYKDMVDQYGFICATVDWEEVTDASILLSKAKKYLQEAREKVFSQLCLEISAVDLHYLNPSIETLKVQETVRCISDPHGMDETFPVTKVELDLINPSNTKYTLGTKVTTSLTNAQNKANSNLAQYVDDTFIPTESKVLNAAKSTATGLIDGAVPEGYANWIYGWKTISGDTKCVDVLQTAASPKTPTGLRVGNTASDATSTSRWLWTEGGLGHWKRSSTSQKWKDVTVNVALTKDGSIVADRITTGCIKLTGAANMVTTNNTWDGTGASAGQAKYKTFLQTFDGNGALIGRWGTEGIWIGKGDLTLGTISRVTTMLGSPRDQGLYEYQAASPSNNNVAGYYKTNDATAVANKNYYSYPAQITDNGASRFSNTVVTGTVFGSNIKGGRIESGPFDSNGNLITSEGQDSDKYQYGSVVIESGKLHVRNGTKGFARFEQAYRNPDDNAREGEYCTIGGSRWYLHYTMGYNHGTTHDFSFNTRDLADLMEWWTKEDGGSDYQSAILAAAREVD